MLEVQKYLTSGKTLDDLNEDLAIKACYHADLPLVILNYNQIDSRPKTHPIVRECRALTLDTRDWSVVAKSMNRFFNWGEVAEEMPDFDFSDFIIQSKEDGSLILIYHFDGEWRVNTRGSFAADNMQFQEFTWTHGILKALHCEKMSDLDRFLDPGLTYVGEFCSSWNKIVRTYKEPVVYLLTAFEGERELTWEELDGHCDRASGIMSEPDRIEFKSIDEIQSFIKEEEENDPTFEGVVIRDRAGRRWKIKSLTYLGLHRLRGEGDNIWNPKHLIPFILAGEEDELLTYFEEARPTFYEYKCRVLEAYIDLVELWGDHWTIKGQKEFAIAIKDESPFAGILFNLRKKYGEHQQAKHLKEKWRNSADSIFKNLFKKKR